MGHPEWTLKPLVLCISDYPAITDPEQARRIPEAAVLSMLGHARGPEGDAVLESMCEGLRALLASEDDTDRGQAELYYDYMEKALPRRLRLKLEEMMAIDTYRFRGPTALRQMAECEARGEARGEVKGKAKGILQVLDARGLATSDEIRSQILSCTDLALLEKWLVRAVTAEKADDIFGE